MCEYCKSRKRIEENKNDNIYFYIWGKHLQVVGKLFGTPFGRDILIEYCPFCGKKIQVEFKNYCKICNKEFKTKNINEQYCKSCKIKEYNHKYYLNLSDEKKKERAEKSKIAMRKIRAERKD